MMRIVVTGASGKLGSLVVEDLLERGYEVVATDTRRPERVRCEFIAADLNDSGDAMDVLRGADAVIHLAAYPGGSDRTQRYIYTNNTLSAFHVLDACDAIGIRRVVLGSSESAYGFFWGREPAKPLYLPVDEDHPLLASEAYGLSKIVNEQAACVFHRHNGMRLAVLRFSLIAAPAEYSRFISSFPEPQRFARNLWSYVDARDAAAACRLAFETDFPGAAIMNIVSDDVLSDLPAAELARRYLPDKELRGTGELQVFVSNRRAKEHLGWSPQYSWKQFL